MDEWVEKRFHLPKSSYISGLVSLDLTPYNRQIMRDLSPQSPIRKVVYLCGTQIGKSFVILAAFGYRVDCRIYGDMLYYFPNDAMAEKWSKTKLDDIIKANDFLVNAIEKGKKGDDNITFKKTLIGALIISGGKSGSKYRMDTGNFIVADDYADFPLNVGATTSGKTERNKVGEGSADKLLEDRGSGTGGTAKVFLNSSPKSENECPAWRSYQQTNKNHFFIECPRCGTSQAWEFEDVVFPHKDYMLTEEPYILCKNTDCQKILHGPGFKGKSPKVYQDQKRMIMKNGIWQPTVETRDKYTNGYRLPSVYSLLGYSLSKMSQDWLDACKVLDETGDESEKIRHRNSKQARPWKRKSGKSIHHSALYKTMKKLEPLPGNCVILGAGVDLQKAPGRIECQINGFGENDRYIIDHVVFAGDVEIKYGLDGSPWNSLNDFLLNKRYRNSFGQQQPIYCAAIDIGWAKDYAKDFLQRFEPLSFQHIFGVFGKEVTKAAINFISANPTKDVDGFETWGLYSNIKKVAIYNLLEKHTRDPKNSKLHFSDRPCFTEQWFKQLTIERPNEKGVLEKPHDHARNEALDCMYLADSAYLLAFREFENGPDWDDFKEWNKKKFLIDNSEKKATIVGNVF